MITDMDAKRLKMRIRETRERFNIPVGTKFTCATDSRYIIAELLEDLEETVPELK